MQNLFFHDQMSPEALFIRIPCHSSLILISQTFFFFFMATFCPCCIISSGRLHPSRTAAVSECWTQPSLSSMFGDPCCFSPVLDRCSSLILCHGLQEHFLYPIVVSALCDGRIRWREDGVPILEDPTHSSPTELPDTSSCRNVQAII